jgi:type II secretory pathway pseudopilin PulG
MISLKTGTVMVDTDCVKLGVGRRPSRRRRLGDALRDDSGFTLVEAVVALLLATIMFTALAYALVGTLRATNSARMNQQAVDLANQELEDLRRVPWAELEGMVTPVGVSGARPDVPSAGPEAIEENDVVYSVTTYVTQPASSTGELNAQVVVSWDAYGNPVERVAESSLTKKSAGLPRPDFELRATTPANIVVAPGSAAVWGVRLINRGAWDNWTLASQPGGLKIYPDRTSASDPTPDGRYDPDIDKDPTSGGTIANTGTIDPFDSFNMWLVDPSTTAVTVDPRVWVLTATSSAQPEAVSATESYQVSLQVQEPNPTATASGVGTCDAETPAAEPSASGGGYSQVSYYLHNSGLSPWPTVPGTYNNTTASAPLDLTTQTGVVPAVDPLPQFATDVAAVPGRPVQSGGDLGIAGFTLPLSQSLTYQMLNDRTWYTNAQLRVFVRNDTDTSKPLDLQAQLFSVTSSGTTSYSPQVTSAVVTANPCTNNNNYREVIFDLSPASVLKLTNSQYLGVRLVNTTSDGSVASFAYDHQGVPARLVVVEK